MAIRGAIKFIYLRVSRVNLDTERSGCKILLSKSITLKVLCEDCFVNLLSTVIKSEKAKPKTVMNQVTLFLTHLTEKKES
jgi:hypothetical protein